MVRVRGREGEEGSIKIVCGGGKRPGPGFFLKISCDFSGAGFFQDLFWLEI